VDINECATGAHQCEIANDPPHPAGDEAECINLEGSYECACPENYQPILRDCYYIPPTTTTVPATVFKMDKILELRRF